MRDFARLEFLIIARLTPLNGTSYNRLRSFFRPMLYRAQYGISDSWFSSLVLSLRELGRPCMLQTRVIAIARTGIEVDALAVDFRIEEASKTQPLNVFGTRVFRHCPTRRLYVFETVELTTALKQRQFRREDLANALLNGLSGPMKKAYREVLFFNRQNLLDSSHGTKGQLLNERIPEFERRFAPNQRSAGVLRPIYAFAVR